MEDRKLRQKKKKKKKKKEISNWIDNKKKEKKGIRSPYNCLFRSSSLFEVSPGIVRCRLEGFSQVQGGDREDYL